MLVVDKDEIKVMLPKIPLLHGFHNDVKQEYKSYLAQQDEQGGYYVPIKSPLTSNEVDEVTYLFYSALDNRLMLNKLTNLFISYIPCLIIAYLLSGAVPISIGGLLAVFLTIGYVIQYRLNSTLLQWYKKQIVAGESLKQYIYMAFNVVCINDVQESVVIIENQNKVIVKIDTKLKDTLEINRVLHTRYSDLANRTPKSTLSRHLDFCKIKLPVPAEYEQQETQLKH